MVRSSAIQSHSLRINDFVGVVVSSGSVGGDGFPLLLVSSRSAVVVASADGGGNGGFPLYFAGSTGFDALGSFGSHYIIRSPDGHVLRPTFSIRCIITPAELLAPCFYWEALPALGFMPFYAVLKEGGKAGPSPPLRCWQGSPVGDICPLLGACVLMGALPSYEFTHSYAVGCKKRKAGPSSSLQIRRGQGEFTSFPAPAPCYWRQLCLHGNQALASAGGPPLPAGYQLQLAVREVMLGTLYMLSSRRGLHFLGGRRTLNGSFFL